MVTGTTEIDHKIILQSAYHMHFYTRLTLQMTVFTGSVGSSMTEAKLVTFNNKGKANKDLPLVDPAFESIGFLFLKNRLTYREICYILKI